VTPRDKEEDVTHAPAIDPAGSHDEMIYRLDE